MPAEAEQEQISAEEFIAEEFAGSEVESAPEPTPPVQRNVFEMGPAPSEVSLPDGEPELDDDVREILNEVTEQEDISVAEKDEAVGEEEEDTDSGEGEITWEEESSSGEVIPNEEEEIVAPGSGDAVFQELPEITVQSAIELPAAPEAAGEDQASDFDWQEEAAVSEGDPETRAESEGADDHSADEEVPAQYKSLAKERHIQELIESRDDSIRLRDQASEREDDARADEEIAERLANAASSEVSNEEVKALLALIEERAERLQGEKERLATMRSLAEMEIARAGEQVAELESARESLEKERLSLQQTRNSVEAVRDSVKAEQERVET